MAELNIVTPAKIQIKNTTEAVKSFVPYKENFMTHIAAGTGIEFEVETAGQVLYFLDQATEGLEVAQIADFTSGDDTIVKLNVPATITITNVSDKTVGFVPYRENFQHDIVAGDVVTLQAKTVGQVLYYLAQGSKDLTVTQA
jgi:hypothetical protein